MPAAEPPLSFFTLAFRVGLVSVSIRREPSSEESSLGCGDREPFITGLGGGTGLPFLLTRKKKFLKVLKSMPYNEHMGLPVRHGLTRVLELSVGITEPALKKLVPTLHFQHCFSRGTLVLRTLCESPTTEHWCGRMGSRQEGRPTPERPQLTASGR